MHDETGQSASEQADRIGRELFLRAFSPSPPPPALSTKLAGILRDVWAKPGDVLFERGDESTTAYFVVSGEIRMVGDDDEEPIPFGAGSIVGMLPSITSPVLPSIETASSDRIRPSARARYLP